MKYLLSLLIFIPFTVQAKDFALYSPDKNIELAISVTESVTIKITNRGNIMLNPTPVNLTIDQKALLTNPVIVKMLRVSKNNTIQPVVRIKSETIADVYNELTLVFKGGYELIFRAYDQGVAYRFRTRFKKDIIVNREQIALQLPDSAFGYLMKEPGFNSMSEAPYIPSYVSGYAEQALFSLPCLFKMTSGNFLLITESDLEDYPGLWFKKENGLLGATLPQKVLKTKEGDCLRNLTVTERYDYLAETKGDRSFPWRIFNIGNSEKDLINNQLVYILGKPSGGDDFSWVQPGLATLDWWGRRNIFGTGFKGGVNSATQRYFVDFNNRFGVKYFVLDEGWSSRCDLKVTNKDINLDSLRDYALQKNVGLVYWTHTFALAQDIAGYMDFLQSKGAAGLKVDFFNRDDQDAINLMHRIAREAAKRRLLLDFHGMSKPFGLSRTYPNLLTSEGLIEFEMNGVSDWANPVHHTMLPFIRMVAGPMDYLPGTMNNAQKKEFYQNGDRPVGLGTRAHSMALAVIFESPMTMWPDAPSDYLNEAECTKFLSHIPVTWDETKVIDAKIGEYVIIARRQGKEWFLGAITNWQKRDFSIPASFLTGGNYKLELIKDGVNADTRAIDYKKENMVVTRDSKLAIQLSTGGGWVGRFIPQPGN